MIYKSLYSEKEIDGHVRKDIINQINALYSNNK